ncbi:MAG: hypothetical protein O2973_02590 [Gemmatimonadetes bacterium]|nr:hypothetical protein [Gemmatimonadota bacterium]
MTKLSVRLLAIAAVASISALPASAQEASGKGFLFGAPSGSFSIRGGYSGASAGSDVFSFVTNELTLNKGDFGSFAIGGDVSVRISPRVDIVASFDAGGMKRKSEFREWEDNSGNPIEQNTAFSRNTYAASAKFYLSERGRSLGRYAWVPARYVPWVSAGMGRTLYNFSQDGDFVDFDKNNNVFADSFKSSQWATTVQLGGGVDWNLNQRFALTTQLKYLFGKADLQYDFAGFDPIDLSGLGLSAGFAVRF